VNKLGRLLIGAALALVPSAALACTCDDARQFTGKQVEEAAQYLITRGLIVADVERIDKGDPQLPQLFRVERTLVGSPLPSTLLLPAEATRLIRTSCDYELRSGFRGLAIFMTRGPKPPIPSCSVFAGANAGGFGLAGLCTYGLLDNPAILRRAIALSKAQAGVSRSSRPRSSSR
jgi:hypothetical protein